ncbi:type I-F CRISPR-associated endoribonuclease Cas6/Csy4 [Psychrobacter lutiphocae]|uniref:type I-F CRISPR-associated endoribonuclease Cas6/Csy4 n=1 Tax=Psychrobacter lutiphocae TaxID=540500 RepID=UPI0003731194|nr:type I-F CRISPR-associated endoribonuclease Cas6/Csy4 [Psychrobacter lutiphocae]
MKYYQELTILPDPEISGYFIWSKLYNQLHIALADIKNTHKIETIGVSFPDYYFDSKNGKSSKLGNKLRVFAPNKEGLENLNLNKWLERLTDYVHIKPIKDVPDKIEGYLSVHRYRFKPVEIQARSLAKKLGISLDDAMATIAKRKPEKPVPYIRLMSETNKSPYMLKVLQQPADKPTLGEFNTYGMNGMSDNITVPHW